VLTIVDTFSRFSPALEPRFTFRGVVLNAPVQGIELIHKKDFLPGS
jgi:hypothetical protein